MRGEFNLISRIKHALAGFDDLLCQPVMDDLGGEHADAAVVFPLIQRDPQHL